MTIAEKLATEFPKEMVRQNPKGMDYVPVAEVIVRLNSALGTANWSHEVKERWDAGVKETKTGAYPKWCMATVRLTTTIDGVAMHHEGIGGQEVVFLNSGEGPVDMGDSWKGAVSDGLKKAAQALGVALELARKEEALAAEARSREFEEQTRELGWSSPDEWTERRAALRARAKELPQSSKDKLAEWWRTEGLAGRDLTRAEADEWERQIVTLEEEAAAKPRAGAAA